MFNVAVVEDNNDYRNLIVEYLTHFCRENDMQLNISQFVDGLDIVNNYKPVYDLIILDIQMNNMDGITAAQKIREFDSDVILIFVTNMVQYAIKGYAVNAYDFIPKPINYPSFSMTMNKVKKLLGKKEEVYLTFPIKGGIARIKADEVKYIEVMNHHLYCHVENRVERLTSGTLSALEEELRDKNFIRVSNSFLVNMRHISTIKRNDVMIGTEEIPISRSKKKDVMSALAKYIQGGI